jgi:topoisomerase-4 subunit A
VLDAVRDESNKDAPVRLVFEPRSRTVEQSELITALLAHTSLEGSVPINLTMVGRDGRPAQKSLRQMLTEWIHFRQVTVQRRTRHRLDRVLERIHVLEGRQLVLLNIDEVIRIIRNADEPKPALIERFTLSERQADDILDIRLRQLARLEAIKIEQELKGLREEQARLEDILGSAAALKRTLITEIAADAKAHGDARRTLVQAERRAVAEIRLVDEPVTVVVSAKGWVRALKGHEVDPDVDDAPAAARLHLRQHQPAQAHRRHQLQVEVRRPHRIVDGLELAAHRRAGVVYEDVETAPALLHGAHRLLEVR